MLKNKLMFKNANLTGKRFDRLLVLSFVKRDPKNKLVWLCLCTCGNTKITNSQNLKAGRTKSCGCLQKERQIEANTKYQGGSAYNNVINDYIQGAKKRNIKIEITRKEFLELIKGDCRYCGSPPSCIQKSNSYTCIYNGVDRVNNNLGYTKDNAVSCCKICNRAKHAMELKDFLSWANRLVKNLPKIIN